MALGIVIACTVLLLLGLLVVIMWGGYPLRRPVGTAPVPAPTTASGQHDDQPVDREEAKIQALRRYLWWVNVGTVAALVSALLAAWPGGRLVMRVLASTSPDSAQGRLTEFQANVGFPTVGGSLELLLFGGLPAGFLAAFLYLVLQRWLPAGRLAGPLFGLLLLIWLGASLDPLRADNTDFNIVGPGWLSVVLFTGLAVLHGAVVAAVAGWWSGQLPHWTSESARCYLPLLAGFVLFPPAIVVVGAGALLVLIWMTVRPAGARGTRRALRIPAWVGGGFIALASAAALPAFVGAVASIAFGAG
jgi:hypothetical protein